VRNYRALSIKQPWLAAILSGWKPVENRTWDTSYRGPLLLHASARIDPDGFDVIRRMDYRPPAKPPVAAILGVAELVDVCDAVWGDRPGFCSCGPWAMFGQYHWRLATVRTFTNPVPAKGALGLWAPTGDVAAAVGRELANMTGRPCEGVAPDA
jgi:hypothetical protein